MTSKRNTVSEYVVPQQSARNKFKAPKKQWDKWPAASRIVFNEMLETMRDNQELFVWGDDVPRTHRRWCVQCWNTAWLAADATKYAVRVA